MTLLRMWCSQTLYNADCGSSATKKKPKPQSPLQIGKNRTSAIVEKGRMYGRWIDMWGTIKTVLEEGIARDPNVDDACYTGE